MFKKQISYIYPESINELEALLLQQSVLRPFIVTGKGSFVHSGAKKTIEWLFSEYDCIHYYDFDINPNSLDVEKGVRLFQESNSDIIISIGGGSVIDMAKLINYYHSIDSLSIKEDSLENSNLNFKEHISIPTTAGSGSESTSFAVMYVKTVKYSISDMQLLPDTIIVDSNLLHSQSKYQMAVSGTDALAHSIESIWNVNATKLSLLYATQALKLIWNNLPNAVLHRDKDAMQKIAIGSNLAGRAINLTKTTAPHALSYGFTQLLGLPHGHSVALSLPYFLELHDKVNEKNCNSPNGVEHVQIAMDTIDNIISYRTNENALNVFFEHIGVKTSLKELGGNEFIYKEVIEGVNIERLSNNPVKLNRKDLLNYYMKS